MQREVAVIGMRCSDGEEVGTLDGLKVERGASVGRRVGNFDVAHFEITHVAEEEAGGRRLAEHAWLGIAILFFGKLDLRGVGGGAAGSLNINIGELDVFNGVARDSAEDGA